IRAAVLQTEDVGELPTRATNSKRDGEFGSGESARDAQSWFREFDSLARCVVNHRADVPASFLHGHEIDTGHLLAERSDMKIIGHPMKVLQHLCRQPFGPFLRLAHFARNLNDGAASGNQRSAPSGSIRAVFALASSISRSIPCSRNGLAGNSCW